MFYRLFLAAMSVMLFVGCGNGADEFVFTNPATAQAVTEPFVFAYSGDNGPGFWYEGGHPDCLPAGMQSPVNITNTVVDGTLAPLDMQIGTSTIALRNNGHGLQLDYSSGSSLQLDGTTYPLLQIHFHTLSEHTVEGERPVMEMHLVHADPSSGQLAVVARFYEVGAASPFLAAFSSQLPQKSGESLESSTQIDVGTELSGLDRYYTCQGSLTTPPCSNIVTWLVLKEKSTLSEEQYDAFRTVMGNNFRPLQKISGRVIRETSL